MTRYLLRRLPSVVTVLVGASFLVFALIRLVPGDPASSLAGPQASPDAVAAVRTHLGLDKPLLSQYVAWLGDVARLDLGRSYRLGGSVRELVGAGSVNTLVLTLAALLIAVLLSLLIAVSSVLVDRPWLDAIVAGLNTLAVAVPTFVSGLVMVVLFAVVLPVLPAGGVPPDGLWVRPDITAQYLLLPALCLALPATAALTRFLEESLRTQLRAPYVTTARALGIPRRRIVLTQALPNALPTAITVLGLQVGQLLGGAVLVEAIFGWPGLGQLVEEAISGRDYPVVQVVLLLSVLVFVGTQLMTDLLHARLDPRVRDGYEGASR